jgi:hemoglobin-like flavoprotein
MTAEQKALVQQTFAQVLPISEQAAALFYDRLFQMDPGLRALFKVDMKEQGKKLMQMIGYCVGKLDSLDQIVPAVKDLGRKHAAYGVKPSDYDTVGAAFLWTLDKGLGPAFTPDVKAAWTAVYTVLASTMQAGAAPGR